MTDTERETFLGALEDRLIEQGLDPKTISPEDLQHNLDVAREDYNFRASLLEKAQVSSFARLWEIFGRACLEADDRAQEAAVESMRDFNPSSVIPSALAVGGWLSIGFQPLASPDRESFIIAAMARTIVEGLTCSDDLAEQHLFEAILKAARGGLSATPLIAAYGGAIVMNRLRLLIATMLRGRVAEGQDAKDAVTKMVEVAVESVARHL